MNKFNFSATALASRLRGFQWLLVMAMVLWGSQAFAQASSYTFAESTTTWTEIIGGTASTAAGDDGFEIVNLPMPFLYNGSPVTQVTISTNGVLRLASGNLSSSWTNDMANTTRTPVAAPYWDDHHLVAGTGTITYTVLGTAPTRKFVVQWKDVTTSGSGSNTSTTKASFQVALVEGTNGIELIYGPSDAGTFSGSIGINSVPGGAGNFISVTPGTPATTSTTVANNAIVVPPASGTIYTFTPPAASTITSAASGLWSNAATWTGGVIPNFASTVTIAGGHSITVDVSPTVAALTVGNGTTNDSLLFSGAAIRNLSVNGDLTVAAGAVLTTTPTTGTSARNIFLGGNFVNNGTVDMSSNSTLLAFGGVAVQTIGGTGTFANGSTIREIQVSNGLTINTPINVSARFTLVAGQLTTNNNLSMDNTLGGVATGGVNFRRSVVTPAINGAVNVGATAVYNLDYVFFTGQTAVNCTTSTEIPASRTINGIRLASAAGTHLYIAGGNLTLTSGSNSTTNTFPNTATAPGALLFSAGKFVVPSGSEIILSNGALANITGGSATAYIEGKLTWTVNSTTAQTRNFRVGDATDNFLVVLGGLNTGGNPQTFTVEMAGAPTGTGVAPVTALMGTRTARITSNGPLGATATVQLNWTATDALSLGTPAELRVVQANAINGSWTERSASSTAGTLASGNRTTTAGVDLANGEFFGFGTTAGPQIAIAAVASPNNSGCYTATETVRALLRNTGGTLDYSAANVTIRGSVTGPTGTITPLAPVTRATGSLAAGATDTIVFATTADLTLQGTHNIEFFIDSLTGQSLAGDTLRAGIRSTVYTVTVTPSTILQGDSARVTVSSPDGIRFSEFTHFYGGTGQTGANYPAYVTSSTTDPDLLEITNFAGLDADMSGFQLEILGTGARTYTFPANTVLTAGGVMIVHVGSGTDLPANNFYNTGGTNGAISSSSATGYVLRDPSGFIVDAVAMNSYVFLAASGVTAADWSGSMGSASGRAGASLASPDNNTGSAWVIANSPSPLQTIGTLNPGFIVAPATVSWSGPGGFTATGPSASTGVRTAVATDTYTATITVNGCAKTASGSLNVIAPVPPIAGFTVSDTVATMGGVVSTLTLTDTSLNVPTRWKWSVVPNNVAFVNGSTDSSEVAQIQFTAPGTYNIRLRVSNIAGADSLQYSTPVVVSLAYCASNATNTADTKIDTIIIGNTTVGTAENACETYTNNTGLGSAATITKGQGFSMMVKPGYCGTSSYQSRGKVFVDGNKNGVFEASEEVGQFGGLAATGSGAAREWFNVQLFVPANADTGVTRLRVIWQETTNFADVQGCGTYSYGETEDFNVTLVNPAVAQPFLVTPANNTVLNVNGPASSVAAIRWNPAVAFNGATSVNYTWQLASRAAGNFSAPLLSLASGSNGADTALVLNFQQLNAALASLNVNVGDTVPGIWRVRAIAGNDTVYSFQTWNIDIIRGTVTDALSAFNLLAPANGTVLPVAGPSGQSVNISWNASIEGNSNPVTYQWLAIAPGGSFSTPTVNLPSNNAGSDTVLTLTFGQIDALLASLGFNVGDSVILDWTVRATSGSFTRDAAQVWRVRMFRGGLAALRLAAAPVANGGTTGLRAPNGTAGHTFFRAASFVPASELAAAGIDSGETIASMALRTTAGANVAARGNFTLYLANGQNTGYTRGTAWTGAITGLNVHHSDSVTLQTGAGTMTVRFSQPFVYTGGSIELAYEWNGSAPFATTGAVYAANTAIASSLVSGASATAAPATLGATAFRPEFIWGVDDRKANEVEVVAFFAKGKNPRTYGTPEVVSAIVRNNGYQVRNNVPVTLAVAGANTFNNVQTVATLGIDSVATVNFANFSGAALGFNNMSVSVPTDDVPANNSRAWVQEQTDSIYAYNDSSLSGLGGVGYNTGSGLLLNRYTINGTRSIRAARMRISNTAAIIGNGLYAVVLNDSGVILAQSAPIVISAADTNQWVVFSFPNPANVTNGNFYIGMAQPANATGYFPMSFQGENPTRRNAYYTAALNGSGLATVDGFRLMIEAHVGAPVIPVDSLSRFSLVTPSNNTVLTLQGDPTQTVNIRWRQSRRSVGTTPVTYQWLLDLPGTTFTNPVVRVNAGTDTSLTFTYGQIVDTLAAKGIAVGAGFVGRWSVRATSDSLSRLATLPFNLTLNRGVMTSIEETDFSKSIVLYPNPAAYTAKLQVSGSDKDLVITVVNAVGQEMKKFTVNSGVRSEIEIDLANLNEGLYFVRISDGSNMAIKRLMIQR